MPARVTALMVVGAVVDVIRLLEAKVGQNSWLPEVADHGTSRT